MEDSDHNYTDNSDCTAQMCIIGLDKSGYQVNSFLITRRKHVVGTH